MTHPPGPDQPGDGSSDDEPTTPYQQGPSQPDYGYRQPDYGYQQPGYHPGYQQPGYSPQGYNPAAPYGFHPQTGIPYSDKSKIVAGLLQVLLPLGIGRMYMGHTGIGVAQLLVTIFTCGIGALWPFVDGILILVNDTKDANGRMLRS
jgi:TM2 domain-containing membrane protein YozV